MRRRREPSFEVEQRWKELVVYWEGGRGFALDAGWGVRPPVLYVPPAADWDETTPPWLHGRRDEVVRRLAEGSKHVVEEGPYEPWAPGSSRDEVR